MIFPSVIYIRQGQNPALRLSSGSNQGLFRKELISIGNYEKGDIKFDVDDDLLHHWKNTFEEMQNDGIEVPMPLGHTENSEARRGTAISLEVDKNEEGKNALFSIFKFRNEEDAKNLKDSDVSIYVPLDFKNGNGKTYKYPIRHIAFTDYPVIPKLGKIHPIAASFTSYPEEKTETSKTNKKGKKMPFPPKKKEELDEEEKDNAEEGEQSYKDEIKQIAEKLGIPTDEIPEDKWCAAINHVVDAIMENNEGEEGEEGEEEGKENGKEGGTGHVAKKVKHEETEYHPPISAAFISMGRKTRLQDLNGLVENGNITPAVASRLAKKYCSDDALQLAFSIEGDILDDFEEMVDALKQNDPVILNKEKSGQQGDLSLSFSQVSAKNNPLLRNAEERARAAGQ